MMGDFKVVKKITKRWTSGVTSFSVVSDSEHLDRNYIILGKEFYSQPGKNQKFNLNSENWNNLKELIDGELAEYHKWSETKPTSVKSEELNQIIEDNPDLLVKILNNQNLKNLSKASFEALDQLGLRVVEIKAENIDFLLKSLAKAGGDELSSFVSILNELKIGQISTIAELVKRKCSLITLLENIMKQKETKEQEIHKLLEKNLWILDNNYELVRSDKPLSDYLSANIKDDPELRKRPDLIIKTFLQDPNRIVVVELKKPTVKLKAEHLGQILGYKGIIERHNPKSKIDLYLVGYDIDSDMPRDLKDVNVDVLENYINLKRNELDEFLKVIEDANEKELDVF